MSTAGDKQLNERGNKRATKKAQRGRRGGEQQQADWSSFNWWAVITLTEILCKHGGACRLGQTRDGGAWAVGIYLGDDYATEYIRPSETFEDAIYEIIEAWVPEELSAFESRLKELSG